MESIDLGQATHTEAVGQVVSRMSDDGQCQLIACGKGIPYVEPAPLTRKGNSCISVWSRKDGSFEMVDSVKRVCGDRIIKMVQYAASWKRLVTLDEDGNIGIWDASRYAFVH